MHTFVSLTKRKNTSEVLLVSVLCFEKKKVMAAIGFLIFTVM